MVLESRVDLVVLSGVAIFGLVFRPPHSWDVTVIGAMAVTSFVLGGVVQRRQVPRADLPTDWHLEAPVRTAFRAIAQFSVVFPLLVYAWAGYTDNRTLAEIAVGFVVGRVAVTASVLRSCQWFDRNGKGRVLREVLRWSRPSDVLPVGRRTLFVWNPSE